MNIIVYPMIVYHGTLIERVEFNDIINKYRENTANKEFFTGEKDFGPGFYTTTDRIQASRWAIRKGIKKPQLDSVPTVLMFSVKQEGNNLYEIRQKIFLGPSEEWAKTIGDHRSTKLGDNCNCEPSHPDILFGPMAIISNIVKEAYKFKKHKNIRTFLDKITKDNKRSKEHNPFNERTQPIPVMGNQMAFYNDAIGRDLLTLVKYAIYDFETRRWLVYDSNETF